MSVITKDLERPDNKIKVTKAPLTEWSSQPRKDDSLTLVLDTNIAPMNAAGLGIRTTLYLKVIVKVTC